MTFQEAKKRTLKEFELLIDCIFDRKYEKLNIIWKSFWGFCDKYVIPQPFPSNQDCGSCVLLKKLNKPCYFHLYFQETKNLIDCLSATRKIPVKNEEDDLIVHILNIYLEISELEEQN